MEKHTAVPSLVCEQLLRTAGSAPRSIALQCEGAELSYEELDRESARVSGYLTQRGVGPGSTVAISMERSFEWIVAALGTMRAGAAYVPLDHGWAKERLSFAIKDSGASMVIAHAELLDSLNLSVPGLDPYRDAVLLAGSSSVGPRTIDPESLAYVIYTSGSSGVPKGVEITHANLAHLIQWHHEAFAVTPRDRVSHLAGLGFDAAVWELWPALAAGATVHLADDTVRTAPELLKNWLIEKQITVSFVPTVLATSMIKTSWPAETRLRLLLTGGDTLSHGPIDGLPFDVINNYGPSECAVVATSGIVRPDDLSQTPSTQTPSIGRPILGTTIHLLDDRREEVPEGMPGEIYIGGGGVGRGYRNLPEATRDAFLPDPFAASSDARMYRSGDIGVRLANGEIQFRGRVDRQVKIRGYRIELDEIGNVLHRHKDVVFATVVTATSEKGEHQLIAYVLPKKEGTGVTAAELQRHLLGSLPEYMIPALFVRLQTLPLSLNGKVDLAMLERPSGANLLPAVAARQPSTPIEEKLLRIMQDLLGSDAITMEDDFFLVGGHSLIGMQLVLRLREIFGVDFTLRQLFQASTVEKLAAAIESMLIEAIKAMTDEEARMQIAE